MGYSALSSPSPKTVEDLYPGLASEVLKTAKPANFPRGNLLPAGGLTIQESEITKVINASPAAVRKPIENQAWQNGGRWFRRGAGVLIGIRGLYFTAHPFLGT